jgi:myo-inositol-1(or 4)-monophosphatase
MGLPLPGADAPYAEDMALVAEVAREAGALSLQWLRKGAEAWDKSPGNPVTEADIAVNDLIAGRLRSARPAYGWLSEENRDDPADREQSRIWVVDPIDGTRAFMRGEPYFCVAIAQLKDARPVVGVLFNPMTDELFAASAGGGATLNGEPMAVSMNCALDGCRMIIRPEIQERLSRSPAWPTTNILKPMPNSIAYRIALVASGRWDAAIGLQRTNDWDIAAAVLILGEAGGIATDGEGRPFVFNRDITRHAGIVAAGAGLHPLLMDRLRQMSGVS